MHSSNYESIDVIRNSRYEYIKGWLAVGVDPNKPNTFMYNQSNHDAILRFNQLLLCLTPPGWADRSPSWKDMSVNFNQTLDNLGFYTYPILQTADIAIVNGTHVPVGEDQVAHIEIAREIVRKFNRLYKTKMAEPQPLLTAVPKLLGINGKKMSSSQGNTISLQENEKSLAKKIARMVTDDKRESIDKPGNPDNCSVYDYHKIFNTPEKTAEVNSSCRSAQLGCADCKKILLQTMCNELMPIAEKIAKISNDDCDAVLEAGNAKVAPIIERNWNEIAQKIKFK